MDSLFSKFSNITGSIKNSIENSAFLKQHTRDYSNPSEYIDAQTARNRMTALPLLPGCSWIDNPDEPLTLKIHSIRKIIYRMGILIFILAFFGLCFYSFFSSFSQTDTVPICIASIVMSIFIIIALYDAILAFFPLYVIFDRDHITVTRRMRFLYRDRIYSVRQAYIRANVSNNRQNYQSFSDAIIDTIFRNYHIYICEALKGNYRWSTNSRKLITVKSIINGFKAANYFAELIHIQCLVKK